MTTYGDSPFAPGIVQDTYVPDQLIAGDLKLVTDTVTITGGAALKRGAVLGQVLAGAATAAAKSGGNTGNGTISAVTLVKGAKVGVYTLRMTAATAYKLDDPDGYTIESAGATGVAFSDDIGFTVTTGGTPFVAGDGFDITVAAGAGSYKLAAVAATDGSADCCAILADDADASGGDVLAGIYQMGEFNGNKLTFGTGTTLAIAKAALRKFGIFIKSVVTADDPT